MHLRSAYKVTGGGPAFAAWYRREVLRHVLRWQPEPRDKGYAHEVPLVDELVRWILRHEGSSKYMAGKKQDLPAWKAFVNMRLSEDEKQAFAAWDMETDDAWELLISRLVAGYKFSITYNAANKTYTTALTCNERKDPNAGYTLTAYAPDVATSIRLLAFKDEVLAAGAEWPKDSEKEYGGIG